MQALSRQLAYYLGVLYPVASDDERLSIDCSVTTSEDHSRTWDGSLPHSLSPVGRDLDSNGP